MGKGLSVFCMILLSVAFLGCASQLGRSTSRSVHLKSTFSVPYDRVWVAAQIILSRYPIKINERDKGVVETSFIKNPIWKRPDQVDPPLGLRYKLRFNLVKTKTKQGRPAVTVIVVKTIKAQQDFFAKAVYITSDGLEEKALLYRLGRELKLDTVIQKMTETDRTEESISSTDKAIMNQESNTNIVEESSEPSDLTEEDINPSDDEKETVIVDETGNKEEASDLATQEPTDKSATKEPVKKKPQSTSQDQSAPSAP